MKVLKDTQGQEINEEGRASALEKAHFLWDAQRIEELGHEEGNNQGPDYTYEELVPRVQEALKWTSNKSAPGPDGIN